MLKASCQLQQVLIGERDGELGRRGGQGWEKVAKD